MEQEIPNFDALVRMAQENPYELELLRYQLAKKTIDSAPEPFRQRLRGLQFQIDSQRKLAKTPLSACIQISGMMHQSLEELRQVLNGYPIKTAANAGKTENTKAVVLSFPKDHTSSTDPMS